MGKGATGGKEEKYKFTGDTLRGSKFPATAVIVIYAIKGLSFLVNKFHGSLRTIQVRVGTLDGRYEWDEGREEASEGAIKGKGGDL